MLQLMQQLTLVVVFQLVIPPYYLLHSSFNSPHFCSCISHFLTWYQSVSSMKLENISPAPYSTSKEKKKTERKRKRDNNLTIMASSTQARKYLIDKLNAKNYRIRKPRMELLLDLKELLEVATGTCQAPKSTQSEAWKDWKNKDKRAKLTCRRQAGGCHSKIHNCNRNVFQTKIDV